MYIYYLSTAPKHLTHNSKQRMCVVNVRTVFWIRTLSDGSLVCAHVCGVFVLRAARPNIMTRE